jgi:hypothetical protein
MPYKYIELTSVWRVGISPAQAGGHEVDSVRPIREFHNFDPSR